MRLLYGLSSTLDRQVSINMDTYEGGTRRQRHAVFKPIYLSPDEASFHPLDRKILHQGKSVFTMHGSHQNDVTHTTATGLMVGGIAQMSADPYYNAGEPLKVIRVKQPGTSSYNLVIRGNHLCNIDEKYSLEYVIGEYPSYILPDHPVTPLSLHIENFVDDFGYGPELGLWGWDSSPYLPDTEYEDQWRVWTYANGILQEVNPGVYLVENTGWTDLDVKYTRFGGIEHITVIGHTDYTSRTYCRVVETDGGFQVTPEGTGFDFNFDPIFDIHYEWEEAMADHITEVEFTTLNADSLINDFHSLPSQISDDIKSLEKLATSESGQAKIAAKLFLSVHYGYKLLASDCIELAGVLREFSKENVQRLGFSVKATEHLERRSQVSYVYSEGHCSVYYDPYKRLETQLMRFAEAVDLVPDLSNVWDMIPYTFVVDWFTNIGELAEGVDAFLTLTQEHHVYGTIESTKAYYRQSAEDCLGHYDFSVYRRLCRGNGYFPWPKFSFQIKNPLTNLYHWFESSALVVSKRP